MRKYYERIAAAKPHLGLIVDTVPTHFDAKWVKDQNDKPGILALAMKEVSRGEGQDPDYQGIPFVVPGARCVRAVATPCCRAIDPSLLAQIQRGSSDS
jgi:alpha,alpha-trehalase